MKFADDEHLESTVEVSEIAQKTVKSARKLREQRVKETLNRMNTLEEKRKENLARLKLQVMQDNLKECSFQPSINDDLRKSV